MATLADLRLKVSRKLGFNNDPGSDDQLSMDGWANEAVREILLRTHCRVAVATLSETTNEKDYELPGSALAILEVKDSNSVPLVRVDPTEIHDLRRAVPSSTSTALTRYAVDGSNLLMVWPIPNSAASITVYYVPEPTEMSTGTHDPSVTTYGGIPTEHHKAVELYMLAEGADQDDDQTSAQGQRYRDLYEIEIRKIRRAQRFKGGRRLPRFQPGVRNRPLVPHNPSQDI